MFIIYQHVIIINGLLPCLCRGDTFHPEFSHLGEVRSIVRSIIPESVRVMAMTATATNTTRAAIIKILDMQKPIIVSIYPVLYS